MRLIDADKLLQEIEFEYDLDYGETLINPRDFADAVCDSPTVDAVPVVRCKGCEHAERYARIDGTAGYYCGHPQNTFAFDDRWDRVFKPVKKPDDFCSRGQRKNQSADVRNMEGGNEHE